VWTYATNVEDNLFDTDTDGCLTNGGRDIAFSWRPGPLLGRQVNIVAWPQAFDGVLHIRSGNCDGAQVACSDCSGFFPECIHARLNDFFADLEQYCLIVDGQGSADAGPGRLAIYAVDAKEICNNGQDDDGDTHIDCDDPKCYVDAGCAPDTVSLQDRSKYYESFTSILGYQGSLLDQPDAGWRDSNQFDPGCVSASGNEGILPWVATKTGLWEINTFNSTYDTVLWVRRGTLKGQEVACNDNADDSLQSRVRFYADAGDVFMLGVDTAATWNEPLGEIELSTLWHDESCDDGECTEAENCLICPSECGPCCGNDFCDYGEDCSSCEADCGTCCSCSDLSCDNCNCNTSFENACPEWLFGDNLCDCGCQGVDVDCLDLSFWQDCKRNCVESCESSTFDYSQTGDPFDCLGNCLEHYNCS
jgi:hypothetical protein